MPLPSTSARLPTPGRPGIGGVGGPVHRGRHLHRAPLRHLRGPGSHLRLDQFVHGRLPGRDMPEFPIEWYVIDEERGWVVCQVWNRMRDPGDGSVHQEYNFTLLKYAGDGKWSYEEDIYNPMRFGAMVAGWEAAKQGGGNVGLIETVPVAYRPAPGRHDGATVQAWTYDDWEGPGTARRWPSSAGRPSGTADPEHQLASPSPRRWLPASTISTWPRSTDGPRNCSGP
jgi:hypothetical protein